MAKPLLLACALVLSSAQAFAHGDQFDTGEYLYEHHCSSCHGLDGDGQGPMADKLGTPPANLLEAMQQKIISDEYLMWTIREGGRNVHTDMPSFEDSHALDEAQAREIIKYLWHAFK